MSSLRRDDYMFQGIDALGKRLRAAESTPMALAELALQTLAELAQPLNAVVTLAPERARAEARAAEAAFATGIDAGPLQGIPYGAKDLLATAGLPTTWGAAPLREQRFAEDATVIRLLRASGAVLTAKLAMVELAGGMGYRQPDASFTGPGRNPWHVEYWTGGSSTGSAAAVACGALPFAIGSETWGSILLPAAYCGIVGMRPTYGLVSRHGAMALSWTMDKIGPLARSVTDCAHVLAVIGVPDPADPASSGRWFRYQPGRFAQRRPRFGLVAAEVASAAPDVARAVQAVIPHLEALGTVEELTLPALPYADVARLTIASEAACAFEEFVASGQVAQLTAPEDRVTPYAYGTIPAKEYLRAQRVRSRIARELASLLDQFDFLIAPTVGRTASRLDEPLASAAGRSTLADLSAGSNLAGLPAVSLPVGCDGQRLPIGLQLVAGAFEDEALLATAARLEERIGWGERPASA